MSGMSGRSLFLDAVAENPTVVKYVQLFRMPLFLTMLDGEFKQYGDAVWEAADTAKEAAGKVMPATLAQFGVPEGEIGQVIDCCLEAFAAKKE